jgi:hypothetical protein
MKLKSASVSNDEIDSHEKKDNIDNENVKKTESPPQKTEPVSDETATKTPDIPFWSQNPNVLFDGSYILEFFPVENMSYEQKLNAVTRTVLLLTILGFLWSSNIRVVLIGGVTIFAIFLMYYYRQKESFKNNSKNTRVSRKEGFQNPAEAVLKELNIPVDGVFAPSTPRNPYSNVLLTDYDYNPNKKPAQPAFNEDVNEDIKKQTMKMISDLNYDQPDITQKLYKDLGEELEFDQSLRQFYSNPSTTIPNDQTSFAEFCYGGMVSCKEGNLFACAKNKTNYTNY